MPVPVAESAGLGSSVPTGRRVFSRRAVKPCPAVSVKQLTGRSSGRGCTFAGDRFAEKDSRTPEQILREDYLPLQPADIVGYEDEYNGCVVKHPGPYQIVATYLAFDLNIEKVKLLTENAAQVANGSVTSKPLTFHVRERTSSSLRR